MLPPLFTLGAQLATQRGIQMPAGGQPQQPPQQAPGLMAPMMQPQAQPQPQQSGPGGLLGGLEAGISSPLFLAGLGLMGNGPQGLSQGLEQGMKLREMPLERRMKEAQIDLYKAKAAGKADGAGKYGLNPLYGVDAQGNPVVMQLNDAGGLRPADLPSGVELRKTPTKIDAGTHWIMQDPITRQTVAVVPKNVGEEATQRKAGELTGQAQGTLPLALASGDRIISGIDAVLEDPGLSRITGTLGGRLPNVTAGANRAQSRLDQIKGGAFLQAFNDLRGAGSISEREGQAAMSAYTRLTTQTMGDDDYRAALLEFKTEVQKLMNIARQRAGQGGSAAQPASGGADAGGWSAREID